MLTIDANTHIYKLYTIKHSFVEHADSTSSAIIGVLTLSPKIDKYLISKFLEERFNIPYMKQEEGYAEMRPENPYRYNHIYDEKVSFSLHVDDPTVYRTEFKIADSILSRVKLSTKFVVLDYNDLTNKFDYTTLSFIDTKILFEKKLKEAQKKIELHNSKPVQKLLKQIDSLSKEDRNLLINNLSY